MTDDRLTRSSRASASKTSPEDDLSFLEDQILEAERAGLLLKSRLRAEQLRYLANGCCALVAAACLLTAARTVMIADFSYSSIPPATLILIILAAFAAFETARSAILSYSIFSGASDTLDRHNDLLREAKSEASHLRIMAL